MSRGSSHSILLIIAMQMMLLCCAPKTDKKPVEELSTETFDLTESARLWADSVCGSLTLRQKVAQLFMPALYASSDVWTSRLIRQYADSCIGGVVLLKGDSAGVAHLSRILNANSEVPPLVSIDAEWGLAMRLADAPEFPRNDNISHETDENLMFDYGRELARECRLLGINMVLGPVLDVTDGSDFMRRRSLGNDPHRVADLSVAYARGLESGNVVSVAKHFPGHGSVSVDSHHGMGVINRSLHEMDSIDLYPFKRWVEQGLSGIMIGHLAVPSIDSDMRPAAVSPTVIRDLLREDMHFNGLVLTDALNMEGARGYTSVDAIKAGADIVLAPNKTFTEIDRVVKAVQEGKLSEAEINNHVSRILFYKYLLYGGVSGGEPANEAKKKIGLHSATSDSIAKQLKNKD